MDSTGYRLVFAKVVAKHLEFLTRQQQTIVLDTIEAQLVHEPLMETRRRRLLRPNPLAPWELRVQSLRVFYEVCEDAPNTVSVLAVGVKVRNKLYVAGQEVVL